jgi:hypothetical protein
MVTDPNFLVGHLPTTFRNEIKFWFYFYAITMAKSKAKLLSEKEFMALGLELAGYDRWQTYKEHCNIQRFVECYGATPLTCSEMWDDLEMLGEIDNKSKPKYFLMALFYLFKYLNKTDIGRFFKIGCRNTVRKHVDHWVEKIQTLLQLKMLSLDESDDGLVYFMTVDGTHCPIREPRPFSKIWSSFKLGGKAGLNYEVGLSINKPKLIWLYGPIPAGLKYDLQIAQEKLIPAVCQMAARVGHERRILADGIYFAEEVLDVISVKNAFDPREVEDFKDRAASRHENFNGLLKNWKILDDTYREHDLDSHQISFEAVAAICCYQLDNGSYTLLDPYP